MRVWNPAKAVPVALYGAKGIYQGTVIPGSFSVRSPEHTGERIYNLEQGADAYGALDLSIVTLIIYQCNGLCNTLRTRCATGGENLWVCVDL